MVGDFTESQGRAFLAHRVRRSSERIVEQVAAELLHTGLSVPPASMLLLVDEQAPIGVAEISRRLQLSNPMIVRIAQRFKELGLVRIEEDPGDARRKRLIPTNKGKAEAKALRGFNIRIAEMFGEAFAEIGCDLIAMLDRLDGAVAAISINKRLSKPGVGVKPGVAVDPAAALETARRPTLEKLVATATEDRARELRALPQAPPAPPAEPD